MRPRACFLATVVDRGTVPDNRRGDPGLRHVVAQLATPTDIRTAIEWSIIGLYKHALGASLSACVHNVVRFTAEVNHDPPIIHVLQASAFAASHDSARDDGISSRVCLHRPARING